MHLYKKTIKPKNTAAKVTSLLTLLSGLFLWIASGSIPVPAIPQTCAIILFSVSIYIASAYLLREYSYEIANNYKEGEIDEKGRHDIIVTELKGKKYVKVCHIELSDVTAVKEINPQNAKERKAQRKKMSRYTYNTQFAASRKIEIQASVSGEDISILLTFDEELLSSLRSFGF